jgi:hypothetical protein
MGRTRTKTPAAPGRRQRTIQMFNFAVKLHREVTAKLQENRPAVVSAAMLAFSKLPIEKQLDHIKAARHQHAKTQPAGV